MTKVLGYKNYGSIPHLPNSRRGPADRACHHGQARIATIKKRDRHDEIIVQEKLDGSNVGVARVNDDLYALTRAGYLASDSRFPQHRLFAEWVIDNASLFMSVLQEGERLVGEWLALAHGTRYHLRHPPFVAFDLMVKDARLPYDQFVERVKGLFTIPTVIHRGEALAVAAAMGLLGDYGFHGAQDPVEGAVWRVECNRLNKKTKERKRQVDFLVKHVRPEKEDGLYLSFKSGKDVWNWRPMGVEDGCR